MKFTSLIFLALILSAPQARSEDIMGNLLNTARGIPNTQPSQPAPLTWVEEGTPRALQYGPPKQTNCTTQWVPVGVNGQYVTNCQ